MPTKLTTINWDGQQIAIGDTGTYRDLLNSSPLNPITKTGTVERITETQNYATLFIRETNGNLSRVYY